MKDRIRLIAQFPNKFAFVDIFDEDDLQKAVDAKAKIYVINEETGQPGDMYFDGEKWLVEKPIYVKESQSIELATAAYVDAVAELVQSELEAIIDVMGDSLPTKSVTTLKKQILGARNAMSAGDAIEMATIAKNLSSDEKALFTVTQAKEMVNGLSSAQH